MKKSEKTEYEHCWEYMHCSHNIRNNCLVYRSDTGEPCWILNQNGTEKDDDHILNSCKQCDWYKKKNGIVYLLS